MMNYKPAYASVFPRVPATSLGAPLPAPQPAPMPGPDPLFTGFTGPVGWLETLLVLGVTGAAAWTGIQAGLSQKSTYIKAAGWVGGVGSALLGLLYIGGRTGYGPDWGLPAVRVNPPL